MQNESKGGRGRFVLGFIAASALWGVLILVVAHYLRPSSRGPDVLVLATHPSLARPKPALHATTQSRPSVDALVAQRLASLHVPAKTVTLPSDLALKAEVAIKQGDFAEADRIASDVLARSKVAGWRFYPFDSFVGTIVGAGNDPQLASQLHAWLVRDPGSALAHLISAQYFYTTGWAVRGADRPNEVPPASMSLFIQDLATAASDARQSIILNSHIPWSYLLLLRTVSDGNSPLVEMVFQQAIHAFPAYYPPYRQRLYMLTPKWGGSVPAMYEFVDRYAGRAAAGSPLKLLYLQLYVHLADAAVYDCDSLSDSQAQDSCMRREMSRMVSPKMGDDLAQSLRLYNASDPIAYSNALWPLLGTLAALPRSNDWSGLGAVLQMAAHTMGSDDQLVDHPGHNNYVLDDITARVWAQIGNVANVRQKFAEAVSDIDHTTFPGEAQRDGALASVFDDMTDFADDTHQWVDLIAYQAAANAIGGSNHGYKPYDTCMAYHALNLQEEAVKECTRLINGNGNYREAHYWRAHSYEALHDWDAALADFGPIADGADNWYRVGAALDMSYIYGEKHDFAGQLASMNEHAYLFDPALQPPSDLAVAFNNRCYAYMQLGHLHKALADCTTSLKYGHIPDAYHKQMELMARLGIKPSL